ncbi:MAG: glycerol kinase GlpK [Myxococcota bacterium]
MARFILAIDQGTTGSTVLVVSESAEVLGRGYREFEQHFPQPGWVEHDVEQIWQSVTAALDEALQAADVKAEDCAAIGITNQRETTVLWERETGRAIHKAIVWQDRRTAERCAELKAAGHEPMFKERTGLVLDPYFSGTKVDWILENVDGARARAEAGELAFGTIDSWLLSRLTAGEVHATDASNASRTLLYNIRDGRYDDELLSVLRVPKAVLPEVRGNSEVYGKTKNVPGLPDGIPIAGMAGDQQAALFGQTCFAKGDAKCTYGTGAFLLMNVGERFVPSERGLVTTIAWRIGDKTTYALEGSTFIAGAAVQWLRDGLGLIESAKEIEGRAERVPDSGGVVFVPALAGLGAPHWDPDARGAIVGLTRGATADHLCRATLEGIAFQIGDLTDAMAGDAGQAIARLRVDGGASKNGLLMQFQSDLCNLPIDRPEIVETTALGAAYLAGLAVGVFDGTAAIEKAHRVQAKFEPAMEADAREAHQARWKRAVTAARA